MTLSASQKAKVLKALAQHDSHKNSYFWIPDSSASARRNEEARNNWHVQFKHKGKLYRYESSVECTCKNYYYRGEFSIDGEIKNRRLFANLLPTQPTQQA